MGEGHIVVVFTIDFYEEKLDYVQVVSRDPLSTEPRTFQIQERCESSWL